MVREYLFRGKRKEDKEWVLGFYVCTPELPFNASKSFIIEIIGIESGEPISEWYEVIAETVSQYIGIKDKVGSRIFENSILRGKFGTGIGTKSTKYKEFNFLVTYHGHSPEFHLEMPKNYGRYRFCPHLTECIIIGNKFDHLELLQSL